ncbi:hypothetical protein DUNSADRAFT_9061 [Dunaliella salina]|uniref:Encoded protein n=1 Tax=Dunaliella salina TaxID=3046 RepID=A0ABQ7GI73_DUNSA|nr:hypothetical protein DUNSADRAFT_9061 [Dunaliella salina]|eukprot:KAF5834318.1 hypothetical protein DUNSADRAFT_9061 [Dunaliella salina]
MYEPKFHCDDSDDELVPSGLAAVTPKPRPVSLSSPASVQHEGKSKKASAPHTLRTLMRHLTRNPSKQGIVRTSGLSMSAKKAYKTKEGRSSISGDRALASMGTHYAQ